LEHKMTTPKEKVIMIHMASCLLGEGSSFFC